MSIGCILSRRSLAPPSEHRSHESSAVGMGLIDRLVRRHIGRCDDCSARVRRLVALESALGTLRATSATLPGPPGELRYRVVTAFHRQQAGGESPRARGRLERLTWAVGALAVFALVAVVAWSRRGDFGPPPRTVRMELPSDCRVESEPTVTIRRASGREEIQ